jgi:Brp/Blh family beta-carotene 15,15'-monooxygenase
VILTSYIAIVDVDFRRRIWQELLYLLVFAVIFKVSSLIWGFAIYFIFWHSLPSLYDQIRFMYNGFDTYKMFAYFKNALPYWLISILGLVGLYFIFKDMTIFNGLFFSFLAAVTLPHSFLISRMFKQVKKK